MKTVHILQTADEVIDAFQPHRQLGDTSVWVGPNAVLDFSEKQPLLNSDTCEIRGVTYDDIIHALFHRNHIKFNR